MKLAMAVGMYELQVCGSARVPLQLKHHMGDVAVVARARANGFLRRCGLGLAFPASSRVNR
jgi:hypothetical protein